jgi:hypothetical protein
MRENGELNGMPWNAMEYNGIEWNTEFNLPSFVFMQIGGGRVESEHPTLGLGMSSFRGENIGFEGENEVFENEHSDVSKCQLCELYKGSDNLNRLTHPPDPH